MRRDTPPAVSIVSPSDGTHAVENSTLTVTLLVEDDVGVQSANLAVNGVDLLVTLHDPPYVFQLTVPAGVPELQLQARGIDTFGHETFSQLLHLPVVADQPPTLAFASPHDGNNLTEGRPFAEPALRRSSTESTTSATSERRTAAPLR